MIRVDHIGACGVTMCYYVLLQDCHSPHLQGTAWVCAAGLGLGGLVPGPTDGQRPAAGVQRVTRCVEPSEVHREVKNIGDLNLISISII